MLISAIGNDDKNTQSSSEILDSLCFSSSCRSGGGSSVVHAQCLCQGDVTPIGQSSDAESFLGAQELVGIHAVPVGNGNHTVVLLLSPVNTGLFLPVEIVYVLAF